MRATDARIILIVKRVIRHAVFPEIAPNLLRSPVGERIHFDQSKFRVPLDLAYGFTRRGLVAADAGDPCVQFLELAAERLNLSQVAALVGIAGPKLGAVSALLHLGREQRKDPLHFDCIFLFDPVDQIVGFGKQEFGIDGEDAEILASRAKQYR